uniref:Uncharacterized protein n=1 Tax=Ciona intestinalis TaxID=7719 RepID=H2XM15_CIOIN
YYSCPNLTYCKKIVYTVLCNDNSWPATNSFLSHKNVFSWSAVIATQHKI